jgi:hypothetical protein
MDNEIHTLQSDQPLQNFVMRGVLFQVPSEDPVAGITSSDNNLIEANDVVDLGVGWSCTEDPGTACRDNSQCAGKGVCLQKQNSGVGFNTRAFNGIVRGNRLMGQMDRGLSFGGNTPVTTLPDAHIGRCSLNATRLCSTNSDCLIPGFDTASQGACVGAGPLTFNGNSRGLTAEENALSGTFESGALFANNTDQFTFRGNTIDGGATGIRISAATNGLIERNVVSGAIDALFLAFQSPFTHVTQLNDFTNYTVAIRTSNEFNTSTDISGDRGNYWGLPCPGFDPNLVRRDNGTVNLNVFDGKPYGEPVRAYAAQRTARGLFPLARIDERLSGIDLIRQLGQRIEPMADPALIHDEHAQTRLRLVSLRLAHRARRCIREIAVGRDGVAMVVT